jgi:hypothetical protein
MSTLAGSQTWGVVMELSARSLVMSGVAVVAASAVAVVPSVRPLPPVSVAPPTIRLSAAVQPLIIQPDSIPSLWDEIRLGIVPSLGASLPTPPTIPGPTPGPTNFEFEDLIQNTYHAIEPWVRYGFELATYAAGWIPWVGWLSPQIMIFYNFGESIFHSFVDNSAEWLWGPLPFWEGLGNWAQDSWNALVQLGIDEWNFWLPGLPPLPFAASATNVAAAAVVPEGNMVAEQQTLLAEKTGSEDKTLPVEKKTVSEQKTLPVEKKTVSEQKTPGKKTVTEAVRDAGAGHGQTVKSEVTTPRTEPRGTDRGRGGARKAAADTASTVSAKDARDTKKEGAGDGTNNGSHHHTSTADSHG